MIDILILSNGPGELATWVRPVVRALRQTLGDDRQQVRLSLVLSPCPNASGREAEIARGYPELDRVQAAERFFPFLLWGQTAEAWDWRPQGVVLFLGGDQLFPVIIGKRLGYPVVIYAEWEARWLRWVDRVGVMNATVVDKTPAAYRHKVTVVGDLMADLSALPPGADSSPTPTNPSPLIGLLPGSKAAKLAQGVPLSLAAAQRIHAVRADVRFAIPVAPSLELATLAKFADPSQNPIAHYFDSVSAHLSFATDPPQLITHQGLVVDLWTDGPAYDQLTQCELCITTVGANTAELGALAVPMIVLIPSQQLDAMRAWDGIPGLLANLPGVGHLFAKLINGWLLQRWSQQGRLLAWPNIWAGEAIVPEWLGAIEPQAVADQVLDWLQQPEQLATLRRRLRAVRGEPGAAQKLVTLVQDVL